MEKKEINKTHVYLDYVGRCMDLLAAKRRNI